MELPPNLKPAAWIVKFIENLRKVALEGRLLQKQKTEAPIVKENTDGYV